LRIILEALKIDKMPKTRLVHLWFFLLFALSGSAYVTMPTGGQIDLFQTQLAAFLARQDVLPFPPVAWLSILFRQVGLVVISLWFILLYAIHWLFASSETTGPVDVSQGSMEIPPLPVPKDQSPTGVAVRAFPVLLLLAVAMILPYLISIPIMGIPFYALISMLSMTVFVVVFEDKTLPSAMEASYRMTRGMKFFIFISFMFLGSITTMAGDLLRMVMGSSLWAGSLIRAFFFALKTLAFGRLAAMFYRSLSAREDMGIGPPARS
jgi:hypothetical protein